VPRRAHKARTMGYACVADVDPLYSDRNIDEKTAHKSLIINSD